MYRMHESRTDLSSSDHPVNPVHPVQSLNFRSSAKRRNLDRINKMNRMHESKNRSLSSDHPVNPVHPVQSLNFRSRAKRRNLDRINKMNRMHESRTDLLAPTILSILFILSNLLVLIVDQVRSIH